MEETAMSFDIENEEIIRLELQEEIRDVYVNCFQVSLLIFCINFQLKLTLMPLLLRDDKIFQKALVA